MMLMSMSTHKGGFGMEDTIGQGPRDNSDQSSFRSKLQIAYNSKHPDEAFDGYRQAKSLLTLGDAVQSFLETPGPTTENMCLVNKREFSAKEPWSATRGSYEPMLLLASFLRVLE